jgi:hypothetical protein
VASPCQEIIQLLSVFAKAFTVPTFANARVLLYGTILAPSRCTAAAALRAIRLANIRHETNGILQYRGARLNSKVIIFIINVILT